MEEVLAKYDLETGFKLDLLEHTRDCIEVFKSVLSWKKDLIGRLCDFHQIAEEKFLRSAFLTVCYHDIGKATAQFQSKIRGKDFLGPESHALASMPFIWHLTKDFPLVKFANFVFHPEILAIASHHSRLHPDLFNPHTYAKFRPGYECYVGFLQKFISHIEVWAKEIGIVGYVKMDISSDWLDQNPWNIFDDQLSRVSKISRLKPGQIRQIHDIFALVKAILHYSDWLASSRRFAAYFYSVPQGIEKLEKHMTAKLNKKGRFFQWQDFQLRVQAAKHHVLVEIPTGQGKTEASLSWATSRNDSRKVIYLLPTMVTANKMWRRVKEVFGLEMAGLVHSTAAYTLRKERTEIEPDTYRTDFLYHKTFSYPVTVATVDQLLFALFNSGHWTVSQTNAMNAYIIIDEIHTYEAYTLGILLKTLEILKDSEAKFAIMSATMPNFLKEKIRAVLGSRIESVSDARFDEMQRTRITLVDQPIESLLDQIIVNYEQGKKVLIVCNTIDDAIHLYRLIPESVPNTQTLLYHSRFINIDKSAKEEIIEEANNSNRPFIAVCTQIVEVSLDINFDVLFSENAPIDALVQRMGRVNRYADKSLAEVVICRESVKSLRIYDESLLKLTWSEMKIRATQRSGTLTERDYSEIVNAVYNYSNLSAKYHDELQEGKSLIQDLWRERTSAIFTINSDDKHLYAKTRLEKYAKVDVVLQQHMTTVQQLVDQRQFSEINDWIIKIPAWWLKKLTVDRIGDDLTVMKCDYSQEIGAQYSEDSSNFVE